MRTQIDREKDRGIKTFITNMTSKWYVFVLSVVFFVLLAFAYLKYATPQYLISGVIMLKDQKNMSESKAVTSFASDNGLSFLLKPTENVMNEMKVLSSRRLALEVVKDLQLNVKVGAKNGLVFQELYDNLPFDVVIEDFRTDSLKERNFEIIFLENGKVKVVNEDEEIDKTINVNESLKTKQYDLALRPHGNSVYENKHYSVNIVSEDAAANSLMRNFSLELTDKSATTASLQLFYPNAKRGEVILQSLMSRYISDNRDKKVRLADSMLVFIDDRLSLVASELSDVERELEGFRSSNRITDLSEQSKLLVGNANEYYNKLKDQQSQLKVIGELESYVKNPDNQRIPSSTTIQNASFSASLSQYNTLLQELEKKKLSYTESNPVLINLKEQVASERSNLLQSIASYKRELQLTSEELGRANSGFNSEISQVPAKERQFVNYSRQQELKQQLYVYLLQKREEANIAKSSNAELAIVVDEAKSSGGPVKPTPATIYIMASMLGLIVPFGFLNARELLRTRLHAESDIEKYTDIEIIGKIGHNSSKDRLAIGNGVPNTPIAEGFRSLRANMYYALQSKPSKVVMVTSSINGEGKTFMSLNLGNSLSMTGKSVLFVELDLRKPKLAAMMGIQERIPGFSDIIREQATLEDCVKPCPVGSNCYLLAAGSLVDNPSELLLNERVDELFKKMRETFDYVIVDSPPVGLVSDAFLIQQYIEMTVYVCRHNYTKKEQFEFINELKSKNKLVDMYLVVNDVDLDSPGYFAYGYGYGYDQGEPNKRNWLKKLKN
ncbi:polysaccharide biosynthesis tyrosine autokinase [Olivibacter sp. SDN3]|uniref:GumC family protein n=1 Tax=Olivibacter sp. SDN3 TaxID=2764720 RepID=UPI0016514D47|nr:polysaccharide biosynthesis tyrosine autokinase [Olivibacter sp. SDN3]QNL52045.1 polysaccharide biosynthesis tyrosine autokinase [Olivibacter sp. SDN3]